MTRSPLFYPLNRGSDSEAGGAADLQTDVMRFMAILSLCLVAIFALVQSMPLAPTPVTNPSSKQETGDPQKIAQDTRVEQTSAKTVSPQAPTTIATREDRADVELIRPKINRPPPREQAVTLKRPAPSPQVNPPSQAEPASVKTQPPAQQPVENGFTLQFETDAALKRLVARQIIGFYAIASEETFRMNIADANITFWSASTPAQFHEMEVSTVPHDVVAAFGAAHSRVGVKWGVTLPADMSQTLNNHLRSAQGGSLVIASSGAINLRR